MKKILGALFISLLVTSVAFASSYSKTNYDDDYLKLDGSNANTAIDIGSENFVTTGTLGAGAITGTSLTDSTATLSSGNLTGMGNITGTDVDISAGTGDYSSSGTLGAGATTVDSLVTDTAGITLLGGQDIRPSADSTTALNIAQADGTDFVIFDSTNKRVGIGVIPTTYGLEIYKGLNLGLKANGADNYIFSAGGWDTGIKTAGNLNFSANSYTPLRVWKGNLALTTIGQCLNIGAADDADLGFFVDRTAATTFRARTANPVMLRATGGNLKIYTDTGETPNATYTPTERMQITNTGNVGIGETAPQDTLEVNGTGLFKDKLKLTQDDGNEYIDSLNDEYVDIGATTGIRLLADTDVTGTIQTDGYKSTDGTAGMTGSCGAATTLTVKDGLITACA